MASSQNSFLWFRGVFICRRGIRPRRTKSCRVSNPAEQHLKRIFLHILGCEVGDSCYCPFKVVRTAVCSLMGFRIKYFRIYNFTKIESHVHTCKCGCPRPCCTVCSCPCCMSPYMLHVHIHAACSYSCCMPISLPHVHIHSACPCPCYTDMDMSMDLEMQMGMYCTCSRDMDSMKSMSILQVSWMLRVHVNFAFCMSRKLSLVRLLTKNRGKLSVCKNGLNGLYRLDVLAHLQYESTPKRHSNWWTILVFREKNHWKQYWFNKDTPQDIILQYDIL